MKGESHLLAKYQHSSLLGFLLFLTLTLILALFATLAHSEDVTLAWDPNSEPELAGYKVYYKTGSSGPPYDGTGATEGDSPIDLGNVTEFTLHDLTDGVTYFFVVTAYDTQGLESGYSNEVNTGGGVTLSITSPQNGFYVNASSYTFYTVSGIAEASASVEIFAGPISLGTTTALADGTWTKNVDFTPCTEGSIILTAESNGETSNAVTGTYDNTPPNAPDVSGTTPTNDTTPTWTWSSGGGGTGTYRYKLDDSNLNSGATHTTATSYTPASALSEGDHTLYVQERDGVGNWSASGSFTLEIDTIAPAAPTITTDGGSGPGNDYTTSSSSVVLEGTCAADSVAIYVNGSTNGVSYTPGQTSWNYNGTLQPDQNPFTIIAKDAAGNASNVDSITVTYTATPGIPIGGYNNENVIPAAQITQSANGDGIITIRFKIKDPTNDPCTLHTFQYSVDGGNTWKAPTNADSSESLASGWRDNGGSKYSSAASFDDAEEHSFIFNTKHADVTGLDGEDQSDVQVRFTVNDGTYNSASPVTSEEFRVDNLRPTVGITYSDPNSSHVDVSTLTITATSSELLSSTPQITIDRPNPMSTIGPVNIGGSGSVWTYNLTVERHNGSTVVDGVNLVTISNVSDLFGNTVEESSNFTTDTRDTDSDGQRDYIDTDDDNDGLPDTWEENYGLDPLDSVGENGRDGDLDNDGWTNYEEYMAGTNPADESSHPGTSPLEIVETIPHHSAGLNEDTTRVPNDTSFCAWIEDSDGIDITDPGSITFTINDGVHEAYTRDLSNEIVVRVVKLTEEEESQVTKFWAVYDRSKDDEYGNCYAFDSIITIGIEIKDRTGTPIEPVPTYTFNIESEAQHDYAHDEANLPDTSAVPSDDPDLEDPEYVYDAGIQVNSGDLEGAKIIYNSNEPVTPRLGPTDEIPPVAGARGIPMNLQPPTVFNTPVKIFIPYAGAKKVSNLHIYLYKGARWVRACDNKGEVQPHGEAWMLRDSRVDHNGRNPCTIEIKAHHFSAVQAKLETSASTSDNAAEVGGGCFIATAGFGSNVERGVHGSPRTAGGYYLTPVTSLPCMLLHIYPVALLSGLILLLPPAAYIARPLLRSNRNFAQ